MTLLTFLEALFLQLFLLHSLMILVLPLFSILLPIWSLKTCIGVLMKGVRHLITIRIRWGSDHVVYHQCHVIYRDIDLLVSDAFIVSLWRRLCWFKLRRCSIAVCFLFFVLFTVFLSTSVGLTKLVHFGWQLERSVTSWICSTTDNPPLFWRGGLWLEKPPLILS